MFLFDTSIGREAFGRAISPQGGTVKGIVEGLAERLRRKRTVGRAQRLGEVLGKGKEKSVGAGEGDVNEVSGRLPVFTRSL